MERQNSEILALIPIYKQYGIEDEIIQAKLNTEHKQKIQTRERAVSYSPHPRRTTGYYLLRIGLKNINCMRDHTFHFITSKKWYSRFSNTICPLKSAALLVIPVFR
jgi:hypothetical protein